MGLLGKYTVSSVDNFIVQEWIVKKHYAKRLPIMQYTFGLFDEDRMLHGVCVFSPANDWLVDWK